MRSCRLRQLFTAPRSIPEEVRNAELCGHVDRLRDPVTCPVICNRAWEGESSLDCAGWLLSGHTSLLSPAGGKLYAYGCWAFRALCPLRPGCEFR